MITSVSESGLSGRPNSLAKGCPALAVYQRVACPVAPTTLLAGCAGPVSIASVSESGLSGRPNMGNVEVIERTVYQRVACPVAPTQAVLIQEGKQVYQRVACPVAPTS